MQCQQSRTDSGVETDRLVSTHEGQTHNYPQQTKTKKLLTVTATVESSCSDGALSQYEWLELCAQSNNPIESGVFAR